MVWTRDVELKGAEISPVCVPDPPPFPRPVKGAHAWYRSMPEGRRPRVTVWKEVSKKVQLLSSNDQRISGLRSREPVAAHAARAQHSSDYDLEHAFLLFERDRLHTVEKSGGPQDPITVSREAPHEASVNVEVLPFKFERDPVVKGVLPLVGNDAVDAGAVTVAHFFDAERRRDFGVEEAGDRPWRQSAAPAGRASQSATRTRGPAA
jgi:hypothetical protein